MSNCQVNYAPGGVAGQQGGVTNIVSSVDDDRVRTTYHASTSSWDAVTDDGRKVYDAALERVARNTRHVLESVCTDKSECLAYFERVCAHDDAIDSQLNKERWLEGALALSTMCSRVVRLRHRHARACYCKGYVAHHCVNDWLPDDVSDPTAGAVCLEPLCGLCVFSGANAMLKEVLESMDAACERKNADLAEDNKFVLCAQKHARATVRDIERAIQSMTSARNRDLRGCQDRFLCPHVFCKDCADDDLFPIRRKEALEEVRKLAVAKHFGRLSMLRLSVHGERTDSQQ